MKKLILIGSMVMLLVMLLTACGNKVAIDDMVVDVENDNLVNTSDTNSSDSSDSDNTKDTMDDADDASTDGASDSVTRDETVAEDTTTRDDTTTTDDTTRDETKAADDADQTQAPEAEIVYDFEDQFMMPDPGEEVVVLHTNYGDIRLRLFPEAAPLAVENFRIHVEEGYYDGLIFHRVMQDFMIQGGDPEGTGTGGESIYGGPFPDEFTIEYLPYRGSLCMANSGANTNGSQFFIVQTGPDQVIDEYVTQFKDNNLPQGIIDNYITYGGTPWLFYVHTTFGQVYEGMDVVDAIAAVAVDGNAMPLESVIIESAKLMIY